MHFLTTTTTFLLLPILGGVLAKSPDNYNYNYNYPPHDETTTSTYIVTMPCHKCYSPEPQVSYPTAPPPYPTEPSFSILPVYSPTLKSEDTIPLPEPTMHHKSKTHHYYPPYPAGNSTMVTYPTGTGTGTGTAVVYSTSSSKGAPASSGAAGTSAVVTQSASPASGGTGKVQVGSVLALVVVAGVGLVL
ncbi:hypothetical protein K440DRAFT_639566 [Wilcoxina mikolae CBS 423.85]|nr:hypothetical protein K440DRAFT_639566 [Wilcoxina mikolae CBS 423.85]